MSSILALSHGNIFSSEYIGYVFTLSSLHRIDKLIVLKKDNANAILSSNERIERSHAFHVSKSSRVATNWLLGDYIPGKLYTVHHGLLMQFGFYSQSEWRYLRYFLHKFAVTATVFHIGAIDVALRNKHNFHGMKTLLSGHQLLVSPTFNSLNMLYIQHHLYDLYVFLNRSRSEENAHCTEYFGIVDDETHSRYGTHDSYFPEPESEVHWNVEHDLTCSGLFIDGVLFHTEQVPRILRMSHPELYTFLPSFTSHISYIFVTSLLLIYFMLSLHIFQYAVRIRNISIITFHAIF
jgi:hypothetical protein